MVLSRNCYRFFKRFHVFSGLSLPMTSESALLLSPRSKRKNEERRNTSHVWQHMKKNPEQKKI
ncbi:hypothetical protein BpHYR1_049958, partial [Brachionus plicatilis]